MSKTIYDLQGNVITPTILLQTKSFSTIGKIANPSSFTYKENFNSANEISFEVYKEIDGQRNELWDSIIDFKIVYLPEYEERFQITVNDSESSFNKKTITGTSLCESELSQINLYGIQINTTDDINREQNDYDFNIGYDENFPSILWRNQNIDFVDWGNEKYNHKYDDYSDEDKKEVLRNGSIVHRIFHDKAPHYTIDAKMIDQSLKELYLIKEFTFDGTDIMSALNQIGEEFGVMFEFNSTNRHVGIRDLYNTCHADGCGYRGDFTDECPNCHNTDKSLIYGQYGDDTTIFVSSDNLATEITKEGDQDSLKNCFKVTGGDDVINYALINNNPNGSSYIYYFNEETMADMPKVLVDCLDEYNSVYDTMQKTKEFQVGQEIVNSYNEVVDYVNGAYGGLADDEKYTRVDGTTPGYNNTMIGYTNLAKAFYESDDLEIYMSDGLLPNIVIDKRTIDDTAIGIVNAFTKLEDPNHQVIAVERLDTTTTTSVKNAVLSYCRSLINQDLYSVSVENIVYKKPTSGKTYGSWTGVIIITNKDAEEGDDDKQRTIIVGDGVSSQYVYVIGAELNVTNDVHDFVLQKIKRQMESSNLKDAQKITSLDLSLVDFKEKIKSYNLTSLGYLEVELQYCRGILDEIQDKAKEAVIVKDGKNTNVYDYYTNLYNEKIISLQSELIVRESQVNNVTKFRDKITDLMSGVKSVLNLKSFIDSYCETHDIEDCDLYKVFCSYRREGEYKNDNYVSTGLTKTSDVISKAQELFERAKVEIYKAGTMRYSFTSSINNLLKLEEFKPLVQHFKVGNWLRLMIDHKVYKLRLLSYNLNYDDISSLSVEFSTATKTTYGYSDVQDVLNSAASMATSYSAIMQQADESAKTTDTVHDLMRDGINAENLKIINNATNQDIVINKSGITCRKYDDLAEVYDPRQIRIISNGIYMSDDGWKTVRSALGQQTYVLDGTKYEEYLLNADSVISGKIIAGQIYSLNYSSSPTNPKGSHFDLDTGNFSLGAGKIVYDESKKTLTLKDTIINWDSTNSPEISDISGLNSHLTQLDGRIQTYSQEAQPTWTDENENHDGDIWIKPSTGITKAYSSSTNKWTETNDSTLKKLADSKAQIFTTTPTPPYYVGDLWVQGSDGEIMNCKKERLSGSYNSSDWEKSSKYTDDGYTKDWIRNTYSQDMIAVGIRIDEKVDTFYQSTKPHNEYTAIDNNDEYNKYVGDFWYDTANKKSYMYNKTDNGTKFDYKWKETDGVPDEIYDQIDGKKSIYTTNPSTYNVNDIYILEDKKGNWDKGTMLVCETARTTASTTFDASHWKEKVKYTDDAIAASKTATNFMSFDNKNGLVIGNKKSGDWVGTRAKIDSDSFDILDANGKELATYGTSVTIGKQDQSRMLIDYHSLQMLDKEKNPYFYISDLRDEEGYAAVKENFIGNGTTATYSLKLSFSSVITVKINEVETTAYSVSKYGTLTFNTPPVDGERIEVTYYTTDAKVKAYTLGTRSSKKGDVGIYSYALGNDVCASGIYSYAEGYGCISSGYCSHAEGSTSDASGDSSHAEGRSTNAKGRYSHAEGTGTSANKDGSHAEGNYTSAIGNYSHAEGLRTEARGDYSHASGIYTRAGYNQFVIGRYNIIDENFAFIVGNGASGSLSNALTVDWSGNLKIAGTIAQNGTWSDRDLKSDIDELDKEKSKDFIMSLKPSKFKYENGDTGRCHHGFIAQDVKESMGEDDWGVYCDNGLHTYISETDEDGNEIGYHYEDIDKKKAIRYEELIADLVATVQYQQDEIEILKQNLQTLTNNNQK